MNFFLMRDPSVSLHVFKSRLKIHLEKESNAVPMLVPGVISASNKPVSFSKLFVKFEKTTYAFISHLHLLYGKLSAIPLQ